MTPAIAPAPSEAVTIDLAFGHTLVVSRTEGGATVKVRAPAGLPDVEIEVAVSSAGVKLRKRSLSGPPPPPPQPTPVVPGAVVAPAVAPSIEPHLSVQQYAALRAECLKTPVEQLAEVRARYGLNAATDDAETAAWARKWAREPALFETYKRLFQNFRGTTAVSASTMAAAGLSRQGLARVLSLREHATMAAELMRSPEEEVYARYGLADRAVRAEALRVCELRLQDPGVMAEWKQLHAGALAARAK